MQQQGFVRRWRAGPLGRRAHAFIVGMSRIAGDCPSGFCAKLLWRTPGENPVKPAAISIRATHQAIISTVRKVHIPDAHVRPYWRQKRLCCTPSGAWQGVLLQLKRQQVTSLPHRKWVARYTHATLVSPLHLKDDRPNTQARPFDDEEHALGLRCGLAVYAYDEQFEPFAALSISAPAHVYFYRRSRLPKLLAPWYCAAKRGDAGLW